MYKKMRYSSSKNKLYRKTNYYREIFGESEKFSNGVPDGIECGCFGSSFSRFDFDFSEYGRRAFNFAMWPQTLQYDRVILKHYANCFAKNSIAIITIVPLSFCMEKYENDEMNWKYYRFLRNDEIENYSWKTKIFEYWFPLLKHPEYVERINHDMPVCKSKEIEKVEQNTMSPSEMWKEAEEWKQLWIRQFGLDNLMDGKMPLHITAAHRFNKSILSEMIDVCSRYTIIPILVIMPMSKYVKRIFGRDFLRSNLYDILSDYENVLQLDLFKTDEFEDDSLYANTLFLNKVGRKKFTREVLRYIAEWKGDENECF